MHNVESPAGLAMSETYRKLKDQLTGLDAGERNALAYFLDGGDLVPGPYQGKVACDAASRSEIVVPLVHDDRLFGVLDLDSPKLASIDRDDAADFTGTSLTG